MMIYLDDRFPDHPKVVKAGDEASWMYVAGLGYSNRNGTLGRIPKAMVGRLTNHRKPGLLAERLVDAKLWEDAGDCYLIHDYEPHNKSAIARSEHAKRAAEARWNKSSNGSSTDARASIEHMPEHMPEHEGSNAGAMLPSRARARPHAHQAPRDQETSSSSVSEELPPCPQPEEEEDSELEAEVLRRLASSRAAGTHIANVQAWKSKTRAGLVVEIAENGRGVLEPPKAKPPDPTEATAAARRQHAERNDARKRGEVCASCEGYGQVLGDDDVAYPCRACGPHRLSVVSG